MVAESVTNAAEVVGTVTNAVRSVAAGSSSGNVFVEGITNMCGQIADCATTKEFIIGVLIGLSIGYLAGAWRGRWRNIGSKPKYKPTAPGVVEIYVGNLSYETDEDQLRKEFEKYGKVISSRIISNHFNHKSKGFGFIEMPNREEAEAAIKALHDAEIQGRRLRVNEAKNKVF